MTKLALVIDSISGINEDHLALEDVYTVPFNVHIGDKAFTEFKDITPQEFYREVEKSDQLPSTAANSIGGWYQVMEDIYEDGADEILCLVTPESLSNMINAAKLAQEMMEEEEDHPRIVIHEMSQILAGGSLLVDEVLKLRDKGASLDDILAAVEAYEKEVKSFVSLGNLEFMLSGGRMAKDNDDLSDSAEKQEQVMVKMGKVLDITGKFENGEDLQDAFVKVFAEAVQKARESGKPIRAKLFKGSFDGRGDALYKRLSQEFPDVEIVFDWLPSSGLAHLGQDSFNLAWGPARD